MKHTENFGKATSSEGETLYDTGNIETWESTTI